ncbi:MAG: glycosyltransferase family 4 protein [Candidatus Glassbacteria bacterium]|nr:glycosyltransferase family 4 protein [Candidatus Glassbacteria bacterium]
MKVLFIVTSFPRSEDDVITPWMLETISRLRARGVETTVYVSSYRGLADHQVHGIPVRRFRYFFRRWERLSHELTVPDQIRRNKLFILLVPFYLFFGIWGLRRILRSERFEVIHVHWPFPHGLFGYFAGRWSSAPVVSQFHGVGLRLVRNQLPFLTPFLRWVVRHSSLVVANSSHTRAEIERLGVPCRLEIVPYGSPVPPQQQGGPAAEDPQRVRLVLFVGRLVERKGVEYLVRALKLVDCPFPVELEVVGTGPEEPALRSLAAGLGLAGRVRFAGRVSSEDLTDYYAACDCFVLPAVIDSRGDTEGLGVVLVEALSYHKPVVASGVGGIVDVIRHEQTGLLVPEKDPEALARAITSVLTDSELASRLAAQGYEHVRRYFDWERITGRWVELYNEITG